MMPLRAWAAPAATFIWLAATLPAHAAPPTWVARSGSSEVWLVSAGLAAEESQLPAGVVQALSESAEVWFETPPGSDPAEIGRFVELNGINVEGDLFARLTPGVAARLEQLIAAHALERSKIQHANPWWAYLQLNSLHGQLLRRSRTIVVDNALKRKVSSPLQSVRYEFGSTLELLAWFSALPESAQLCALTWQIGRIEQFKEETSATIAAWSKGDTDYFDAFNASLRTQCPDLQQAMVVDRNRRWVPRIREMLQRPGRHVVVVGSGHLTSDPLGLPALLRAESVVLEPR